MANNSSIPKKTTYHRQARQVMENILGRKLSSDEEVHHKDGNIKNNDPSNLKLYSTHLEHAQSGHDGSFNKPQELDAEYIKNILTLLDEGYSVRNIAKELNTSKSKVARDINRIKGQRDRDSGTTTYISQISKLKQEKRSIRDIAHIVGKSKSKVSRDLAKMDMGQNVVGVSHDTTFEMHNYQATIKILEKPVKWEPRSILTFKKLRFEVKNNPNWDEYYFPYNDCSVHITPDSVLLFPPKLQSKVNAEDVKLMISQIVIDMIPKLEKLLELKLSGRPSYFIEVPKGHAVMKNEKIWDILKKHGFDKVYDDHGIIRLMLDNSEVDGKREKHIESHHSVYNCADITLFEGLVKDVITKKYSLQAMNSAINTNQQAILSLAESIGQPKPIEPETPKEIPSYIN